MGRLFFIGFLYLAILFHYFAIWSVVHLDISANLNFANIFIVEEI